MVGKRRRVLWQPFAGFFLRLGSPLQCKWGEREAHRAILKSVFMMVALSVLLAASASAADVRPAVLALRGGASLPQTVMAASGSALSLSGIAALVDHTWLDKLDGAAPPKHFGILKKRSPPPALRRRRLLSRFARGAFLVSWGVSKLAISRLTGPALHTFARLNIPAILGLVTLQKRSGRVGFLPLEAQATLAGLYAFVALGFTSIPRLGPDKYPDRFLVRACLNHRQRTCTCTHRIDRIDRVSPCHRSTCQTIGCTSLEAPERARTIRATDRAVPSFCTLC